MSKIPEPYDDKFSTRTGRINWTPGASKLLDYDIGEFKGPLGIVTILKWGTASTGYTRFDFCYAGQLHIRTYRYCIGEAYCTRLARKFAEDICAA